MTSPAPPVPELVWPVLRAAEWAALNVVGLVGGGFAGLAVARRANAHNDWGATGLLFVTLGAVAGSSLVVGLGVWVGVARRGTPGSASGG